MNIIKPFIPIIVFSLFTCSSPQPEWVKVASIENGDADFYVNTKTITTNGIERNAWTKMVYKEEQNTDSYTDQPTTPYNTELHLGVFDCTQRTMTVTQEALYDSKGKLVAHHDFKISLGVVLPNSVSEIVLKFVCQQRLVVSQPKFDGI